MRRTSYALLVAWLLAGIACVESTPPWPEPPSVLARVTSATCSSDIEVTVSLDGTAAMAQRFFLSGQVVNLQPILTTPGVHVIGARITGNLGRPVSGFTWPDTTVTLVAGQRLVRTFDLYCS